MPATDDRYPALVERALRLIEERGEPVEAGELCRELFGAAGGPWARLLGQVLGADGRLVSAAGRTLGDIVAGGPQRSPRASALPESGA